MILISRLSRRFLLPDVSTAKTVLPPLFFSTQCSSGDANTRTIEDKILQLIDGAEGKELNGAHVRRLYNDLFSEELDYKKEGHGTLSKYIKSFPKLRTRVKNSTLLVSRASAAENKHLPSVVDELRGSPGSSAQLDEKEHPKQDPSVVEERVLSIIDRDGENGKVSTSDLPNLYEKRFSAKLDYSDYRSLRSFLDTFSNLKIVNRKSDGYVGRADATLDVFNRDRDCQFVDSLEKLDKLRLVYPFDPSAPRQALSQGDCDESLVAVDCEGVPERLLLIQVAVSEDLVYVFDTVTLGAQTVCDFLSRLLTNSSITKLFHDLHNDSVALARHGINMRGTLDTQLAMEAATGNIHIGLNTLLQTFNIETNWRKNAVKSEIEGGHGFALRPLSSELLAYAIDDVRLLKKAELNIRETLGSEWTAVKMASDLRAHGAQSWKSERLACFDVANSNRIASLSLLNQLRPNDICLPCPIEINTEIDSVVDLLPSDIADEIKPYKEDLSEIQLDEGRRPVVWLGKNRKEISGDDRIVLGTEIEAITANVGQFRSDNRAAMAGKLHRISAIRNLNGKIVGLTIRIGRYVLGVADIFKDLLHSECRHSILFLGEPGSSKTTVVREVTRHLAEEQNVCVVDTSNEIAGDGDVPHHCIGKARRLMVPSLSHQKAVMTECVQNHTPQVMVIDEIGRYPEVKAAQTCKNRGIQLIASAHGANLRDLVSNSELCGLVGDVERVILGDTIAQTREGDKIALQRAELPVFDVVVELKREEMRVVLDVPKAVDNILKGKEYLTQLRKRDPFRVEIESM